MESGTAERAPGSAAMVQHKPRLLVPGFLPFQHPRLVDAPPAGPGWGHEIKLDGYRVQLRIVQGEATLFGRHGDPHPEWLGAFPAAPAMPDCILDAELCAVDDTGRPDFSKLKRLLARSPEQLTLFAFDLLWLGPDDQRPYALPTRKALLKEVVDGAEAPGRLAFVDIFKVDGAALLRQACAARLEGIVSKRLDAGYKPGRGETWTKAKCRPGQEVVIGGWKTENGHKFIGFLAGVYEGDQLRYVGSVKNGLGDVAHRELMAKLKPLESAERPFALGAYPRKTSDIHWARPDLVANVEIAEWTGSGNLRQASYKGLRDDKDPREVVREG